MGYILVKLEKEPSGKANLFLLIQAPGTASRIGSTQKPQPMMVSHASQGKDNVGALTIRMGFGLLYDMGNLMKKSCIFIRALYLNPNILGL